MSKVLNDFISNPITIGLLIGLPGSALTYLGIKRAKKADENTEKADAVEQIIDGLNKLVANLQTDNTVLRKTVKDLQGNLLRATSDRDKLRRKVYYLQRKYGENGQTNK